MIVGQHQINSPRLQRRFELGQTINVKKLELLSIPPENMDDQLMVCEAVLKVEYAKETQNNDR
jgi:hypothetical protein